MVLFLQQPEHGKIGQLRKPKQMPIVVKLLICYLLVVVEFHDVRDGLLLQIQEGVDDLEGV